jgi:hypothetical protein
VITVPAGEEDDNDWVSETVYLREYEFNFFDNLIWFNDDDVRKWILNKQIFKNHRS